MTKPPIVPDRRSVVPSTAWVEYFWSNAATVRAFPWTAGAGLTDAERRTIATSIAEFQLGESSEGAHLLRFGRLHAVETGDADYLAALRLFIAEEHRHAADLGRFMDLAGLPKARRTWVDSVFRALRRRSGLERSIVLLLTAEVVATVYYRGLRDATGSPLLRALCDQILDDEAKHVEFQTQRLAILRRGRPRVRRAASRVAQWVLTCGTCLVVWPRHRRVLRAGGLGLPAFAAALWRDTAIALRLADPARDRFAATTAQIAEHDWWAADPAVARPTARALADRRV